MRKTCVALVMAALAAGCGNDDGGELSPEGEVDVASDADSKGDRDDAAFTLLRADVNAATTETRKVFTTADGYEAYFGQPAPAEVDWDRDWVVYYAAGARATGGYRAVIRRIALSATGLTLKVTTSLESPGADCFVTQATTAPFVLARFKRPASAPERVRFYRDDVTHACTQAQPLELTDASDGGSFEVKQGQDVIVRLSANPTTGYEWKVVATDRTFGYPASTEFTTSSDAVGAGGTTTLVWRTQTFLSLVGEHRVSLAYQRGDGEPARTFSFTVNVLP